MEVTLLGTGDTTGTPTVGCGCDTCEAARERGIERTRFSVHVENERTRQSFLVDTSPDFRRQFLDHDVPLPESVLITHIHFDHLHGLGNVFRVFDSIPVYAAGEVDPETGESVAGTVRSRYTYLGDRIDVREMAPFETVRLCGLDVTLVPVVHPPLLCYGLAVEDPETGAKLSITGDTNYDIAERTRDVLRDPDLLLADAIVPGHLSEIHPVGGDHYDDDDNPRTFARKHMTREGALHLASDLGADRTRLVHVSHYYPAEEAFEEPLAVDGERYTL